MNSTFLGIERISESRGASNTIIEDADTKLLKRLDNKLTVMGSTLPTIKLSQSSFEDGTYRITKSGRYLLTENIKFNPHPSHYNTTTNRLEGDDWMPTKHQIDSGVYPVAPIGPYHMGFFAAFTVETDNVVIDLNGFTVEQHMEHYVQQRFFSIIELAPTPFISGQGPSNFGNFQSHKNILIHNGILGLSSHSAIHGNGTQNVVIKNITCYDYEQAGIQINGGDSIYIHNVQLERNSRDALTRATYSQGRFIRSFLRRIIAGGDPSITINGTDLKGSKILEDLEVEMDRTFNEIVNLKRIPTSDLFRNPDSLHTCDGSVYGILLNTLGAAVGPFLSEQPDYTDNRVVKLENVTICDLNSDPVEVPALCVPEDHSKAQRGPVGDVIRIQDTADANGIYVPTTLANAQFYWNKHSLQPNASKGIIDDWVSGNKKLEEVMKAENICFMHERDAMSHIMKGNIGIFLSGSCSTSLASVIVRNIENRGAPSKNDNYDNYEGNRTRGIAIVSSKQIKVIDTNISLLKSQHADCYGIDFVHSSNDVRLENLKVTELLPSLYINAPNHKGHCMPIRGKQNVTNLIEA